MQSNEYIRMTNMGQWLEKYLNPSIKTWEYRELAQDAYQMYDVINYEGGALSSEYALSRMVRFIEKQPKADQLFYRKRLDVDKYTMIGKGKDPLKLRDHEVMPNIDIDWGPKNDEHNLNRHLRKCAERCLEVYWFQAIASQLFKRVSTLDRWEDALLPDGTDMEYSYSEIPDHYSKLFQEIGIDNPTRDIRVLTSIKESHIKTKNINDESFWSVLNFFPWNVFVSRIVMDFLFAGGKDYFAFCQYCGKFSAGKRKGEKKFCSDNCRSLHRHKMIKCK